jgi:hypothetical protein
VKELTDSPQPTIAGPDQYNLACLYALASHLARDDSKLPPAEREELAEHHAQNAILWLERAKSAGFFADPAMIDHTRHDADLTSLAPREDFRHFLERLDRP